MVWFQTRYLNSQKLSLVIEPLNTKMSKEEFFKLLQQDKETFLRLMLEHGGLLFRGFPLESHSDFSSALKVLDTGKFLDYIGGDSPRKKIAEGIYTSTEAPPSVKIPLHNELSFVKYHPRHIFFFCETASENGGETIVADSRKVYAAVDPAVRDKFI